MNNCSRCGKSIINKDEMVADFIEKEYPNTSLCEDCYLIVFAAGELSKVAALKNCHPKKLIEKLLKNW